MCIVNDWDVRLLEFMWIFAESKRLSFHWFERFTPVQSQSAEKYIGLCWIVLEDVVQHPWMTT